jgi:glycerol-3-phosphate acyltransferase PlsY
MDPWIAIGAALVGYCLGAVSFARIITARVSPGTDISHVQQVVPGMEKPFVMDTVSATSVHTNIGKKYGCLTALMDMAKVTIPTVAMGLWQPEMPYDLIVATSGVIGHNWPVFYRFKGGRGESPIIGGLLAIDPLGLLVVNAVGSVLGIALGSMLVLRWSGFLFLIPWSWLRTHDVARVAYVITAILLYVIALRSELRQYIRLKLDGKFPSQEAVAEFLAMGKGLGRIMDRYSFFAIVKRLRGPGVGCLLLAGIQVFPVADARAQTPLFEGQASLMLQLRDVTPPIVTGDLRYFPALSLSLPISEEQNLSGEVSLNMGYRVVNQSNARTISDHTLKLYRSWARFAGRQWEVRAGLQRINFGSATVFRPLMWFDRLDPRDPLQITEGISALLGRYYLLNNTNLWMWVLYGRDEKKGWEFLPSKTGSLEYGGRIQVPVLSGEAALTYHHRTARLAQQLPVPFPSLDLTLPEDRIGIDGKWDAGAGVWCESSLTRQQSSALPAPWQRALTLGTDYSFPVADGLQLLAEYFVLASGETAFGSGSTLSFAAVSASLNLGLVDNLTGLVYHDLRTTEIYVFVDWRRTYDSWVLHLMGYWNPDEPAAGLPQQNQAALAGRGLQCMVLFNH